VSHSRGWNPLIALDLVALDKGSLALVLIGQEDEVYFEIGGIPEVEEGG
jgi:hypothetical protein